MTRRERVVIAGAGRAGVACAEQLRRDGYDGGIDLIGAEPWLPYERPQVSKGLLGGTISRERATLPGARRFGDLDITWHGGRRVLGVDGVGRSVDLDDGQRLRYDHLVIATGTRPRTLPDIPLYVGNVCTLRTFADAQRLDQLLDRDGTVVVIGGGFIGSEAASTLVARGRDVAVIDPAPLPLARAVGNALAQRIVDASTAAGVEMHLQRVVRALRRDAVGMIDEVELDDGTRIPTAVVIVAAGSIPVAPWGDEPAGIAVDELGRMATPGMYACGDVASWRWQSLGEHRRVEHWLTALGQGRAVARTIMGSGAVYDEPPVFWSDQFGMRLQRIGHSAADTTWVNDPADGREVTWMHGASGSVTGVAAIDRPDVILQVRTAQARALAG